MGFTQSPPQLLNPYDCDRVLPSILRRELSAEMFASFDTQAHALGELIANDLYPQQLHERLTEPRHQPFDAWGRRVDRIDLTPLWQRMPEIIAQFGFVWHGYDGAKGEHARLYQFAMVYLFAAASDFYACPLAMTDGAARALLESGNRALIDRAVPHFTARTGGDLWTSGQWMTETTGGSDVGGTQTRAVRDSEGQWRIHGHKWFTSAVTSEAAILLARPDGNPAGTEGLALFYLEPKDSQGLLQNIVVDRLKDKLGSRKLPTAELSLNGAPATLVGEDRRGVRLIAPLLNQTRVWNSLAAMSYFRRGLQLLRDYATRRQVFGKALRDQVLHHDTLAGLQAEFEAGLHLSLHVALLMGRAERELATPSERLLLRVLVPIVKLMTAKQSVSGISEIVEGFGGAGYIEDTGLPSLLRDVQVFSIWEGTTDVLSLDAMKVLRADAVWQALGESLEALARQSDAQWAGVQASIRAALLAARITFDTRAESAARGIAMTIGRAYALAVLLRHATWSHRIEKDTRPSAAAQRFADHGIDRLLPGRADNARRLATDDLE